MRETISDVCIMMLMLVYISLVFMVTLLLSIPIALWGLWNGLSIQEMVDLYIGDDGAFTKLIKIWKEFRELF